MNQTLELLWRPVDVERGILGRWREKHREAVSADLDMSVVVRVRPSQVNARKRDANRYMVDVRGIDDRRSPSRRRRVVLEERGTDIHITSITRVVPNDLSIPGHRPLVGTTDTLACLIVNSAADTFGFTVALMAVESPLYGTPSAGEVLMNSVFDLPGFSRIPGSVVKGTIVKSVVRPYTYKAVATIWVFMLVLFALSASDAVTGRRVLLIVAMAFAGPLTLLTLWPRRGYASVSDRALTAPR